MPNAIYPLMVRSFSAGRRIVIAIGITLLASLPGLMVAQEPDGWFASLHKPPFAPPDAVFGPVWTVLYIMIGTAAGLGWAQVKVTPVRNALMLYGAQILLHVLWTVVFFGMHAPYAALVVISLLLIYIVLTIQAFNPISRMAVRLKVPYLLWVVFATVLNVGFVRLN